MNTTHYYTRDQVVEKLRERFKLFNAIEKKEQLTGGYTDRDHEIIGEVLMALGEPNKRNQITLQQYESTCPPIRPR